MAGEDISNDPPSDIGRSAGRKRHDHCHRLCGIVLSLRPANSGEYDKQRREFPSSHRPLPYVFGFLWIGTIPWCGTEYTRRTDATKRKLKPANPMAIGARGWGTSFLTNLSTVASGS